MASEQKKQGNSKWVPVTVASKPVDRQPASPPAVPQAPLETEVWEVSNSKKMVKGPLSLREDFPPKQNPFSVLSNMEGDSSVSEEELVATNALVIQKLKTGTQSESISLGMVSSGDK